jgi:hypothetical protein
LYLPVKVKPRDMKSPTSFLLVARIFAGSLAVVVGIVAPPS